MTQVPGWLIGASFMLNLALGGFVAGDLVRGHMSATSGTAGSLPAHERDDARSHERMDAADRQEIRRLFRAAFEAASAERSVHRQAERSFIRTLAADPFDEAEAAAAFRHMREADTDLRDRIGAEILAGLPELDPRQRMVVARILARASDGERRRPARGSGPARSPQQEPDPGSGP